MPRHMLGKLEVDIRRIQVSEATLTEAIGAMEGPVPQHGWRACAHAIGQVLTLAAWPAKWSCCWAPLAQWTVFSFKTSNLLCKEGLEVEDVDNLDNSLACHKPALQVQPSHSILKGDVMQDHLPEALGGTRQRAEASQALHRQRMCIKESSMLPPQETAPCPGCRPPQEAGHPSGASCPIQPSSSTLRATGQQDTTRTSRLKF